MSIAIKQIYARDGQADSRRFQKPFIPTARLSEEKVEADPVDYWTDFQNTQPGMTWIRSLNHLLSDANDGISLIQIASDALTKTYAALQEMRQLTDRDSPGYHYDPQSRYYWLQQVQQISQETQYNRQYLLDGRYDKISFNVGGGVGQAIWVKLGSSSPFALGFGRNLQEMQQNWRIESENPNSDSFAEPEKIAVIDGALNSVADLRASLGPLHDRFEKAVAQLNQLADNSREARSRIQDEVMAEELVQLTRSTVLKQARSALQTQANQQPQIAMRLLE
ncbi:MAG: hypothetical protein HQL67_11395 [Magnetococcales bacterium]|nr:hypothetical protein [Magnetococcales bacterium]